MSGTNFKAKFEQSERIKVLEKRNHDLAVAGKRRLESGWEEDLYSLVYGWNPIKYVPKPGEKKMQYGDHACWIDIGEFPKLKEVPSKVNGYEMSGESWGRDYAFMIDNTPASIYPCETIVGEIYWQMSDVRQYDFDICGEELREEGRRARELGYGGVSTGHTCPDLMIGLQQGFGGLLKRIKAQLEIYEKLDNPRKMKVLKGFEMICESNIRYIQRYASLARDLAAKETDQVEKQRFEKIAAACEKIATQPPETYYEAVQWIYFAILFDRSVGHGNGYGRIDLYLIDFYREGLRDGSLTRTEAREYVAEIYMKLRGHFFSMGGRDAELQDATNEMSWVALEAYDLIGDYNNLVVMWHPEINEEYYDYACDVLARHGESIPILMNYDIMYESELRNGIPHEHAWTVTGAGCQWYCIPGREYCDQDTNVISVISPLQRAMRKACGQNVASFRDFYDLFIEELQVSVRGFRNYKRVQDEFVGDLWPEMFTSLICHGPIDRGIDCVAPRGVDYQFTSVNILGIPNTADSLTAIKKVVFEEKKYSMQQLVDACRDNWDGLEEMRQCFLNQPKYGNDIDEPDKMLAAVATLVSDEMGKLYNQKGQEFRPSLFAFMNHYAPELIGATPDGRRSKDYLAHGINPTVGMSTKGLLPSMSSLLDTDLRKFQGASITVDLQPKLFDGKENHGKFIKDLSIAYFKQGGLQINLHIMDFEKLKDAMEHPENPEYQDIVVRVTGYCARFVTLTKEYQKEFVSRATYGEV